MARNHRQRDQIRRAGAARTAAVNRLIAAHLDEYNALYEQEANGLGIVTHCQRRKAKRQRMQEQLDSIAKGGNAVRVWEQVDRVWWSQVDAQPVFRYSWVLDGASARGVVRKKLEAAGWKWLKGTPGCRGCYVTNDYATAKQAGPHVFGLKIAIESNGSHKIHNAPMYEDTHAVQAAEPARVDQVAPRLQARPE